MIMHINNMDDTCVWKIPLHTRSASCGCK